MKQILRKFSLLSQDSRHHHHHSSSPSDRRAQIVSVGTNATRGPEDEEEPPPSAIQKVMTKWRELDEKLTPFDRLESMRKLVAEGNLGHSAYGMLHGLAVTRATGGTPKSLTSLRGIESPIMAGYLSVRVNRTWRKKFVMLFSGRVEYYNTKAQADLNLGTADTLILSVNYFLGDAASRRLKNDKPFSFMISDFETTHFYAAESQELKNFWMFSMAKTLAKLVEAKTFFERGNHPQIFGRTVRSPSAVEAEYLARVEAYKSSILGTAAASSAAASDVSPPAPATTSALHAPASPPSQEEEAQEEPRRHAFLLRPPSETVTTALPSRTMAEARASLAPPPASAPSLEEAIVSSPPEATISPAVGPTPSATPPSRRASSLAVEKLRRASAVAEGYLVDGDAVLNRAARSRSSLRVNRPKSVKLLEEVAELEAKRLEHDMRGLLYQTAATDAQKEASELERELSSARRSQDEEAREALQRLESKRIQLEERAAMETYFAGDYQELAEEKREEAIDAAIEEEVQQVIDARMQSEPPATPSSKPRAYSMRAVVPPLMASEQQLDEKTSEDPAPTTTTEEAPTRLLVDPVEAEVVTQAIEVVAKRVDLEHQARMREADAAIAGIQAMLRTAEEAREKLAKLQAKEELPPSAPAGSRSSRDAAEKERLERAAAEARARVEEQRAHVAAAAASRDAVMAKATALHRALTEARRTAEESKARAAMKLKLAKEITSVSELKAKSEPEPPVQRVKRPSSVVAPHVRDVWNLVKRVGRPSPDGEFEIPFGELCLAHDRDLASKAEDADDESIARYDICGALKFAKRYGALTFEGGEQLFRGQDDGLLIRTVPDYKDQT